MAEDCRMETLMTGTEHAELHAVRAAEALARERRVVSPVPAAAGPAPSAPLHAPLPMPPTALRQLLIVGVTKDGQTFRPSDWSERLAGAMSAFRPDGGHGGIASFIGYSPYCVPRSVGGHKCVLVNEELRGVEVMAWDFVMSFARDNGLEVRDVTPVAPAPGTSASPQR